MSDLPISDLAVIEASYSDFKLIKTRSSAQIILEIPIEQAERALSIFGVPMPGAEIRVAVARIVEHQNVVRDRADTPPARETATDEPEESADRAVDPIRSERSRSAYRAQSDNEKVVTRSAILCADPAFWKWAGSHDAKGAADFIRKWCHVKSRRDFAFDADARKHFLSMEHTFSVFAGRTAEPR